MQFLSFSIRMTQIYYVQNFFTFGSTKTFQTCQTCKPTQNELVLLPKLPNMFCGAVLIIFHQYDQNFFTFGSTKTSKLVKVANQPKMSWFCPQNPRTWFIVQFLLFSISTAHKYFGQNFVTFGNTKTFQTFKPTKNEFILTPKTPENDLLCSSYRFSSVQAKNISLKTLSLLVVPKLPKLANHPKMSWFCPQNPRTWFVVQFILFSINSAQKYFGQNFVTFGSSKTSQTCQPTQTELVLPPKPPEHDLQCSSYRFSLVRPKNISVKTLSLLIVAKLSKLANQPKMSRFCPQNPPNMICCVVLIVFSWVQPKYILVKTLSLLVIPKLSKLAKLTNQPKMSWFCH